MIYQSQQERAACILERLCKQHEAITSRFISAVDRAIHSNHIGTMRHVAEQLEAAINREAQIMRRIDRVTKWLYA